MIALERYQPGLFSARSTKDEYAFGGRHAQF
jgi:hypothetical protein